MQADFEREASVSRGDRLIGIAIGIVLGLAIVAIFVFAFSEDAVDAPSLKEGSPTAPARER